MSTVLDPVIIQTQKMARSSGPRGEQSGYCLWEFRNQNWNLKKDCCREGYVPSQPPTERGHFQGQIRALAAVPAGNAAHERAVQTTKA